MANKTFVEKAAEKVGYGLAMAEDVAGTVKTAIGSVTEALIISPAKKVAKKAVKHTARIASAKKAPGKSAAKKSAAKKSPAKKSAAKKSPARKAPAKRAAPNKGGKKLTKKPARKSTRSGAAVRR